jgi:hypothetical protein
MAEERQRFPIANSIGRQKQEAVLPGIAQQILSAATMSAGQGPMLDQSILNGAPPWAVYLMNLTHNVQVEVEAFKRTLVRRGLVTDAEFMEALAELNRATEEQFRQQAGMIERAVNQRSSPTPTDPRRSPT